MKIKNITPGARGVHSIKGPVMIEPGAEVDVELSEAEEAVSRATGWFEFEAAPTPPKKKG